MARFVVLLAVAMLALIGSAVAIDAEEIAALNAIVAHYPELGREWTVDSTVCDGTLLDGVDCSGGEHVYALQLELMPLTAMPTQKLGNISGLRYISHLDMRGEYVLDYDDWYSQLPSLGQLTIFGPATRSSNFKADFGNNSRLSAFSFTDHFMESFPVNTLQLPALRTLSLSMAKIRAFPPNLLVVPGLDNMMDLTFFCNDCQLPTYTHLTPVQHLRIHNPTMTTLPTGFGSLSRLGLLTLSAAITHLPSSVVLLPRLMHFKCSPCKLNQADSIPSLTNSRIYDIDLGNNSIATLPTGLCSFSPTHSSITVRLKNNPLTSLPDCWLNSTQITGLHMSHAHFTAFPSVLTSMAGLGELTISRTPSLGTNMATIPDLNGTQMYQLELSDCALSGTIPSHLSSLSRLQTLSLQGNQFTGTIPPTFLSKLTRLQVLDLSSSSLSGTFPSPTTAAGCTLSQLRIGGNQFTQVDNSLLRCPIRMVDLSGNPIEGLDAGALGRSWPELVFFNVANCPFHNQSLPTALFSSPNLLRFNASGSGFTGTIPDILKGNLQLFDVSSNRLTLCKEPYLVALKTIPVCHLEGELQALLPETPTSDCTAFYAQTNCSFTLPPHTPPASSAAPSIPVWKIASLLICSTLAALLL